MGGRGVALALVLMAGLSPRAAAEDAAAFGARFTEALSPGGIAFLHRFDDATPYAAINFGWRDHSGAANANKAGLPSLTGALLMQSADGSADDSLVERMNDLAASASLNGSFYQFRGNVRAPAKNLAEAMKLTAAALKTAVPSEKVFKRLMQQVVEGEAAAIVRSETIAQRASLQLGLGDHPAIRSFATTRFDGLRPADVTTWRQGALDRARLKVVVSGKISAADAGPILDAAFADLPAQVSAPTANVPVVPAFKPRTIVIERATAQSALLITGKTEFVPGPPAQMTGVANGTLGAGSDGRIFQAVRVALGASYGGGSGFYSPDPDQRLLQMTATVANDQVASSLLALRKTYATWQADGVTAAELAAVVTKNVNGMVGGLKDPASANNLALNTVLADRPISDLHDYAKLMMALTTPDLNDAIRTKFPKPEQLMTVVVTPSAARLIEAGITVHCVISSLAEVEKCQR
jgi:predicted Zn-dependent peptidase